MNDLIEANVTCATLDCPNSGHTILVMVDSVDLNVICGPCGQKIEDVIPVGEEG